MEMTAGEIRAAVCTIRDRTAFLEAIRTVAETNRTHIICLNAEMVAGTAHVRSALDHAVRSFAEGKAISNTLEMETLLYAAGSRQCNIGASFGIREGGNRLFVCCHPGPCEALFSALAPFMTFVNGAGWDVIDSGRRQRLMQLFGITPEELGTLGDPERFADLVLERVALLDVMK
jgi:KEOPS complex subunit Cgi121